MEIIALLFATVLLFLAGTSCGQGIWPSRWSPCSNPALYECGKYATCTGHKTNDSNLYTGIYDCECVYPYVGNGKVEACKSPCTEDLKYRHAVRDYSRPGCRKDGYFSNTWCGHTEDNHGCRCVNNSTGQVKNETGISPCSFDFDTCIDDSVTTGRCKIADEDRKLQSVSLSFISCDIWTGNYKTKMCDLTCAWQCWCVDTIRGMEKSGTRVKADAANYLGYCDPPKPLTGMCLLPHLENGRVSSGIIIGKKIENRATAYFSCNTGFRRRGPSKKICRQGKLSRPLKTIRCEPKNL